MQITKVLNSKNRSQHFTFLNYRHLNFMIPLHYVQHLGNIIA